MSSAIAYEAKFNYVIIIIFICQNHYSLWRKSQFKFMVNVGCQKSYTIAHCKLVAEMLKLRSSSTEHAVCKCNIK
jgi:hypothetical protein